MAPFLVDLRFLGHLAREGDPSGASLEEALSEVARRFPFPGYFRPARGSYANIARTVRRHLLPGSSVLDFGAGPADATAVVQALGYRCSAFDDLRDPWHLVDDNRERILAFARAMGIDYCLAEAGGLPFERGSFDLVMIHDVLEHLHDSPRDLMNDLVDLVRPGGYLFATVPNAVNLRKRIAVLLGRTNLPAYDYYYWHPGAWRGHVREYVRDDLARLAAWLGLEVVELRGCSHMLTRLPAAVRPVWQAVTSIFRGVRDTWMLVARKPQGWEPRRTRPDREVKSLLEQCAPYRFG